MKASEAYQLNLFDKTTPIETVVIKPTKEMPLEVYRRLWRISYFMELMDRLLDGRVLWDEERSDFFADNAAEAEYYGIQNDWLSVTMELPKALVEEMDEQQPQPTLPNLWKTKTLTKRAK